MTALFARGGADLPTWVWVIIGVIAIGAGIAAWLRETGVSLKSNRVVKNGEPVVVWAIGIDPALFKPCRSRETDYCGPASVLVPSNPDDGYDVDYMEALVEKCLAFAENRRQPKEDEQKIARELRRDTFREGVWMKLPKAWLNGDPVFYTLMPVYRNRLPDDKVRKNRRFFRAVVDFENPKDGAVHRDYHDDDEDDGPYDDRPRRKRRPTDD